MHFKKTKDLKRYVTERDVYGWQVSTRKDIQRFYYKNTN